MATGDPVARRIIFSTHVVPTQTIEGEEKSVTHKEFQPSPSSNGAIGGKGIATINADQWGDGWVSFSHHKGYWEEQEDLWNLQGECWEGTLLLTDTGQDLTDDTSPSKFLYIKNTGTTYNALLALDETGIAGGGSTDGNYFIIIPPGGSVALRGDGANVEPDEVFLKCGSGETTTIEFIIAIE